MSSSIPDIAANSRRNRTTRSRNVGTNTQGTAAEHKDPETDDEENVPPNSDEPDVMSNDEFARLSQQFRRSEAYSRRRTNIALTTNSAELLRNELTTIRTRLRSIIRLNNLMNITFNNVNNPISTNNNNTTATNIINNTNNNNSTNTPNNTNNTNSTTNS